MEHDFNQKSEGKKIRTLKFLFTLTWAISLIVNLPNSIYQSIYIKKQRLKKVSLKHIWYSFFLCVLLTQSCLTHQDPTDCSSPGSSVYGILQERMLEWVHFLLQGIFPIKGSNLGLPHCRQILYHLSH